MIKVNKLVIVSRGYCRYIKRYTKPDLYGYIYIELNIIKATLFKKKGK
jgi:hypothetical protein